MKISTQGILQSGFVEAHGNAKIYGENVTIGANLINGPVYLENDKGNDLTLVPYVYNGIHGYRLTKTTNSGYGSFINFPIKQSALIRNKPYSFSIYAKNLADIDTAVYPCIASNGTTNVFIDGSSKSADGYVTFENILPKSSYDATHLFNIYGWHISFTSPCDIFIANPKVEEGTKATPWVPYENMFPLGNVLSTYYNSTVEWEPANLRYKITSRISSSIWGVGIAIPHKIFEVKFGETYRVSMEVYVPTEHKLRIDVNNEDLYSINYNGNDNDNYSTRLSTQFTIPANTWTPVCWGTSNNDIEKNPNKLALYPYDGAGILTTDDTEQTVWYIRNFTISVDKNVASPTFANNFYEI